MAKKQSGLGKGLDALFIETGIDEKGNVKDNSEKFADSYRRVLMITAAVICPIMVGMIAVAEDMFMLLLGPRWMDTVPYFKILSLAGLFYPLSMIAYNILKVGGNGKLILRLEIIKKTIMTLILAIAIPHSVIAIAWGLTVMAAVEFALNTVFSLRFARLSIAQLVKTLLPIAILSASMYCIVTLSTEYLLYRLSLPLRFTLQVVLGATVYTLCGAVLKMEFFKEIYHTIKRMF